MYRKQLALLFKVYQHLISSTLPLLNNNPASLHCNLATWMKAASEKKRTKCEGCTVSGFICLCTQVYMNILRQFSLLEMAGDFPGVLESSWAVVRSKAVCPSTTCPLSVVLSAGSCSCLDMQLFLAGTEKTCISFCSNEKW